MKIGKGSRIATIIPARKEEKFIGETLTAL